MSFSQDSQFNSDDVLVNEINMTPLIDVMLVLLIIFIITLPVINKAIKVELPKGDVHALSQDEKSIDISITASGAIAWDKEEVDDARLQALVAQTAAHDPVPVVRVYADKVVPYERVIHLLTAVQKGGLSKIDFVTDANAPHAVP